MGDGCGRSSLDAMAFETCGQAETSEALPLGDEEQRPVSCVLRDGAKAHPQTVLSLASGLGGFWCLILMTRLTEC